MTDRELMQQALHTLEGWANHGKWVWPESALEQAKRNTTESITALRERLAQSATDYWQEEARRYAQNADYWRSEAERLAQPEMQPCAGRNCGSTNPNLHSAECFEDYEKSTGMNQHKPLTEEEINNSYLFWIVDQQDIIGFGRSIETKLRKKNT